MKKIAAIAALIATLALTGCSSEPVKGFIYKKNVNPAQTVIIYTPCGKVQCPIYSHIPECYEIEVDTPRQTTEALCIEQEEWLELEVGQYYEEGQA